MSQLQFKWHNYKNKIAKNVPCFLITPKATCRRPPLAIALLADALIHSKTCCKFPTMVYNNQPLLKNSNSACFLTPKPAVPPCRCVADNALHAIH
jgi:hypothetical protein